MKYGATKDVSILRADQIAPLTFTCAHCGTLFALNVSCGCGANRPEERRLTPFISEIMPAMPRELR